MYRSRWTIYGSAGNAILRTPSTVELVVLCTYQSTLLASSRHYPGLLQEEIIIEQPRHSRTTLYRARMEPDQLSIQPIRRHGGIFCWWDFTCQPSERILLAQQQNWILANKPHRHDATTTTWLYKTVVDSSSPCYLKISSQSPAAGRSADSPR